MQGLYYLLSIVAVFVVLWWYIRNDKVKEGEPTTGLLAMKTPDADTEPAKPNSKRAEPNKPSGQASRAGSAAEQPDQGKRR
jgi:hypothetical protein